MGVYFVSKIVLLGLTKVLVYECFLKGVRVNCVVLGIIKIKFSGVVSEMKCYCGCKVII